MTLGGASRNPVARWSVLLATLLVLVVALGCARSDWIGATLATVDVSGDWTGTWVSGTISRGSVTMKLNQQGAKVTGTVDFRPVLSGGAGLGLGPNALRGAVSGDTLRVDGAGGGLSGELTVGLDEMSGLLAGQYSGTRLHVTLRRQ